MYRPPCLHCECSRCYYRTSQLCLTMNIWVMHRDVWHFTFSYMWITRAQCIGRWIATSIALRPDSLFKLSPNCPLVAGFFHFCRQRMLKMGMDDLLEFLQKGGSKHKIVCFNLFQLFFKKEKVIHPTQYIRRFSIIWTLILASRVATLLGHWDMPYILALCPKLLKSQFWCRFYGN